MPRKSQPGSQSRDTVAVRSACGRDKMATCRLRGLRGSDLGVHLERGAWTMRFQRAAVWSAFAAANVLSGVAIGHVDTSDRRFGWWLVCALIFAVVAAKASQMLPAPAHKVVLAVSDSRGALPLLGDVSPVDLGVYPNRYTSGDPARYISRDCDMDLLKALGEGGRVVVVHGERLAGCTRTLVEAAKSDLSQRRVLVVGADPELDWDAVVALASKWGSRGDGAVLWLDSLTRASLAALVPWLLAPILALNYSAVGCPR
jgi:hypothetical protein